VYDGQNTLPANEELTFWSITGQKLETYNLSQIQPGGPDTLPQLVAAQTATNYYFGGKLIKNSTGYVTPDRLGSIGKYFPYGQERPSATTDGKEKFATYFRDSETGLDYAKNRYHQPGMGRFMTPDPYGGSISIANPSSWNRYAYVGGDPVNRLDPLGLCNAILGGITQSDNQAFGQLAGFTGADQAYPYAGLGTVASLVQVASAASGPNQATQTVYDAIMAAAGDPGPINIVAYSGGAGAFAAVIAQKLLPADVVARIASVTYLSPGALGDIPIGPWHTQIYLGDDSTSALAELNTTWGGGQGMSSFVHPTSCDHFDTACFLRAANLYSSWGQSGLCSDPSVFSRPQDYGGLGSPSTKTLITPGYGPYEAVGGGVAQNVYTPPWPLWDWSITRYFDWETNPSYEGY
jgi:RHS repeat-associated protein